MFIIVIDTCRNIKKDIEGATLRCFCEALAVDLGWACCTKNLFLLQLSVYGGGSGEVGRPKSEVFNWGAGGGIGNLKFDVDPKSEVLTSYPPLPSPDTHI